MYFEITPHFWWPLSYFGREFGWSHRANGMKHMTITLAFIHRAKCIVLAARYEVLSESNGFGYRKRGAHRGSRLKIQMKTVEREP